MPDQDRTPEQQERDRAAVAELVLRERAARDNGMWAEMAAAYHPDSSIEVSWFKGTGAEFVELSRRNLASGRLSLHQMAPAVVTLNDTRALAESACQMIGFVDLDGVAISITNHARLLWRAERFEGRWLVAGLRIIYVRDAIAPVNPSHVPMIDEAEAARYRLSYRYLSYFFARTEHGARDDLPGIDRPDLVEAVRAGEAAWLADAD